MSHFLKLFFVFSIAVFCVACGQSGALCLPDAAAHEQTLDQDTLGKETED